MVRALVWTRGADGAWEDDRLTDPDAVIRLPAADVELPLTAVYADVPVYPAAV